jgi:hypothetical protein
MMDVKGGGPAAQGPLRGAGRQKMKGLEDYTGDGTAKEGWGSGSKPGVEDAVDGAPAGVIENTHKEKEALKGPWFLSWRESPW